MQKILTKLHTIMSEVERMEKDGKNTMQNYNYLSETQITEKMKDLLTKHKVLFSHSTSLLNTIQGKTAKGTDTLLTQVQVAYKFYDVESGEYIEGTEIGQGQDTGDKGVYKAVTGAVKYIFMKNFMIPTGDDPEKDTHVKPTAKPRQHITGQGDCPECNGLGTIKFVPAGKTKTGKSYPDFYACTACEKRYQTKPTYKSTFNLK